LAASTFSNIRLDADLTENLPTNTYKVLWEGDLRLFEPAVHTERSLTGKLHIHKLLEGTDTKVFAGRRYKLLLGSGDASGHAEVTQLSADLGTNIYFMPHYRDEGASYEDYRSVMYFKTIRDVTAVDSSETYFTCTIELEESTGNTV